jgi:signal transduction histidine kinase
MLFQDTGAFGLPPNHLLLADERELFETLANVRLGVVVALIALAGIAVARRWRGASRAQRRALAPVYASGGLVLLLYAIWSITGIAGADQDVQENLERARVVALALVPFAFLAGLLRSRVAGATAVSALVASLGDAGGRRGRLREALSDALGDPSLELAFWLPDRGGWVDEAGAPVTLPGDGSARTATTIEREGRPLATIVHDLSLAEQADLVRAIGGAASLALENERLDAELRANLHELRESRARIVESADAARGIHPAVLSDRGLGPALDALASRLTLPVEIGAMPSERLPETVEVAAYFVVAEALTNVVRYAQATHARIDVTRADGHVTVAIADDGVGGADPTKGSGLRGLADRVAALDGRLEVDSEDGRGTTVRAVIPSGLAPTRR